MKDLNIKEFTDYNSFEEELNKITTSKSYYAVFPKTLKKYSIITFKDLSEMVDHVQYCTNRGDNILPLAGNIKKNCSSDKPIIMIVNGFDIDIEEICIGGIE